MKRFLSLLLTLCLLLSVCPTGLSLADIATPTDLQEEPAAAEETAAPTEAPVEETETPAEDPQASEDPEETENVPAGNEAIVPVSNTLAKPVATAAVNNYTAVTVSWSSVSTATSYEIQYRVYTGTTEWKSAGTATSLFKTVTGLTCGTEYAFRVRALSDDGAGNVTYSDYSSVVRCTPVPLAPATVTAKQTKTLAVTLTWKSVTGASGYYIHRSTNGGESTIVQTFTSGSVLTWDDTDVVPGNTYDYEVNAYRTISGDAVEGLLSTTEEVECQPLPPTNLKAASLSSSSIKVTWNADSAAESYVVYRSTNATGYYTQIGTSTTTSYTDTSLVTGSSYYYKVASVYGEETGEMSDTYATAVPTIATPADFKVATYSDTTMTLSWTADPLATSYVLDYGVIGGPMTSVIIYDNSGTYKLTGLTPGTGYNLILTAAIEVMGNTLYSDPTTVLTGVTRPTAPGTLTVTLTNFNKVTLNWTNSSADGYEIYRSTNGTSWSRVADIAPATTYADSDVTCGVTYSYKVRAYSTVSGVTRYSNYTAVGSCLVQPLAVTGLSATVENGTTVVLYWAQVSGATGYRVQMRVKGEDAWTNYALLEGITTTTCRVTGLDSGVTEEFRVFAYRTVSGTKVNGLMKATVTATPVPSAPATVSVSVVDDITLKVTWSASVGATGYEVFVSDSGMTDPDSMTLATDVLGTTATVTGLVPGKTYTFVVRPYAATDADNVPGYPTAGNDGTPRPAKPASLKASLDGATQVTLTWKATSFKTKAEHGYQVMYSEDGGATWSTLVDLADDACTYTDTSVSVGVTRMYKVRAYLYSDGVRVYSVFTDTVSASTVPTPATSVTVSSPDISTITISFYGDVVPTRYMIYRSLYAKSGFQKIGTASTTTAGALITYDDTTAEAGVTYYYKIRPVYSAGGVSTYGAYSAVVSGNSVPAKVTGVTITNVSVSSVKVSWTKVTGATGYEISRSFSAISGYKKRGAVTTLSATDTGLSVGTTYYYKVRAYVIVGTDVIYGPYSTYAETVVLPGTPKKFQKASGTYNSVTLTWSAVSGVDGYRIYKDVGGVMTLVTTLNASTLSYTASGLNCGDTLTYYVDAYVTVNDVVYASDPATLSVKVCPPAPTGLTGTTTSDQFVQLSWDNVEGAVSYQIDRSANKSTWTTLGTSTVNNYLDTTTAIGDSYYYRVRAVGANSTLGSVSIILVTVAPVSPSVTVTVKTPTALQLKWNAVIGADGYQVYRATGANGSFKLVATVTGTTYTNSGLTCGKTYYYKVCSFVKIGGVQYYSGYSQIAFGTPRPANVVNLKATPSVTSVKLTWAAVTGASGYEIKYKLSTASSYTTKIVTGTSATISSLSCGKTYDILVRAFKTVSGKKVYSADYASATATTHPAVPKKLTLTNASYTSVKATWSKMTGASGYEVWASTDGTNYTLKATVTTNTTTLTGLTTGSTVYVRVRSYALNGSAKLYSGYCSAVSITVRPTAPKNLKVTSSGATTVTLTWGAVAGASGYVVYKKVGESGSFTQLVKLDCVTTYTDTVSAGDVAYYRVKAFTTEGGTDYSSSMSSTVSITVEPNAPTLSITDNGDRSVTIKFSGATGSRVYLQQSTDNANWTAVTNFATSVTSYTVSKLTAGTKYYFRARTYVLSTDGDKLYSSWTTASVMVKPTQVLNVKVTSTAKGSQTVSWTKVTGATGYQVYRATSAAGTYKLVDKVTANSITFMGLTSGTTYYYKVRAYTTTSATVTGKFSAVVSGTCK